MKKIFRITILTLLIAMSCISSFALNATYDIHSNDVHSEVIFAPDSEFTEFQKQNIINHFMVTQEEANTVSVEGILCLLFGHDLTTERMEYRIHRYYASIPRCLQEMYDISICSRCDYMSSTLVFSMRVPCCP